MPDPRITPGAGEELHPVHPPNGEFSAERNELEVVLSSGIMAPSSNGVKLLRMVCERYFSDPSAALTEYDLAVGALGRRVDFDPRSDSGVRVEMTRLRKRLHAYYEREGAAHKIQIQLLAGQYRPVFAHMPAGVATRRDHASNRRILLWPAGGAVMLVLLVGTLVTVRKPAIRMPVVPPPSSDRTRPAIEAYDSIRLLAGSRDNSHVDALGQTWVTDRYFEGGTAVQMQYARLDRAAEPALFEHARSGHEFRYDLPLKPGHYELRLYFAEPSIHLPIIGDVGDAARLFNVFANDEPLLPPHDGRHLRWIDIVSDAGGTDIAVTKVIKDVRPGEDGKLHLRFSATKQEAVVNAIEVVPGLQGRMHPVRLRAALSTYQDRAGNLWLPDRFVHGGRLSLFNRPISGTQDPALYQGERFGHFSYHVPVSPGTYTVTLHFAENFYTVWNKGTGKGARLFNIYLNGVLAHHDLDVYALAGGALRAFTITHRGVPSNPRDEIVITFEPVSDYAILNAIEVVDEGK